MITMNEPSTVAPTLWCIEKVCLKCHGWFNLLVNPFVLRRLIHLSSWDSKIDVKFSSGALSIFSMLVNFACIENSSLDSQKCCSTGGSLSKSIDLILCL